MTGLQPKETLLVGNWELIGGQVRKDPTEERIERLIASSLEKVVSTAGGWEVLYRDPGDGRYWELTFPQSELHGGGPRSLRCIEQLEAENKYGIPTRER